MAVAGVELWAGTERLAVHPRATRPGQWASLPQGDGRRRPAEPLGRQRPAVEVEQRPLAVYDLLAIGAGR
jgi:hypothetical protein